MAGAVSTLTAEEVAEVEALAGLGLSGNLPPMLTPRVKSTKKTIITYTELLELRPLGVPLDGLYVRLTNGTITGVVEASKVAKWTTSGFTPVEASTSTTPRKESV